MRWQLGNPLGRVVVKPPKCLTLPGNGVLGSVEKEPVCAAPEGQSLPISAKNAAEELPDGVGVLG
jgi:hypothetical protein